MHATPFVHEGVTFPSCKALADHLGLKPATLCSRLRKGWAPEAVTDPQLVTERPTTVAGQTFKTLTAACQHFGVNYNVACARLKAGWNIEQALEQASTVSGDLCEGVVYLITNSKNRLKYVGVTTCGLDHRARQHVNAIRSGAHGKLYAAVREIGLDHFKIRVLETVTSRRLLRDRERYWIEHYNSFARGYNARPDGGMYGRHADLRVSIDGVIYLNARTAATALGVHLSTVHRWLANGRASQVQEASP